MLSQTLRAQALQALARAHPRHASSRGATAATTRGICTLSAATCHPASKPRTTSLLSRPSRCPSLPTGLSPLSRGVVIRGEHADEARAAKEAAKRLGGWVGQLRDERVIRLTMVSANAPAAELLKYLHNLMTADVYAAVDSADGETYTMFLNPKGRVLFDAQLCAIDDASVEWMKQSVKRAVYQTKGPAVVESKRVQATVVASPPTPTPSDAPRGFYLTVNASALPLALQHLQQFNLRRRIRVEDVSALTDVYAAVPFRLVEELRSEHRVRLPESRRQQAQKLLQLDSQEELNQLGLRAYVDTRLRHMGVRIILKKDMKPLLGASFLPIHSPDFFPSYRVLLGLSESGSDLLPDKSLPLEHGLESLGGGVSFHKGCYMGQELTARTHSTGVVRKRSMPAVLMRKDADKSELTGTVSLRTLINSFESVPFHRSADPFLQLQHYFPYFNPPTQPPPVDTAIYLPPRPLTTATVPLAKEAARVTSTACNVVMALLRLEHAENPKMQLELAKPATLKDGKPLPPEQDLVLVPYKPNWWAEEKKTENKEE